VCRLLGPHGTLLCVVLIDLQALTGGFGSVKGASGIFVALCVASWSHVLFTTVLCGGNSKHVGSYFSLFCLLLWVYSIATLWASVCGFAKSLITPQFVASSDYYIIYLAFQPYISIPLIKLKAFI